MKAPPRARKRGVLDASALLAYLHKEPGGRSVESALPTAALSAVNLSEVLQKSLARGVATQGLSADLEMAGVEIAPFTAEDAEAAAHLWRRASALSLGDRACLALAQRLGVAVYTCDRAWAALRLNIKLRLVR